MIVKCCPGALCQTPLNGLHSRKQSVAVTKGLVGMGPVMIDLHWNSEDVSAKWEMSQRTCRVRSYECVASSDKLLRSWRHKKGTLHHLFHGVCPVERRRRTLHEAACWVVLMANGVKHFLLLILFFIPPLSQNKSQRTYCMSAPYLRTMRARSCLSRQGCRLSGGVSACSVTTTPGVRLITEGSKGHELHSGGGSLRGPPRSDSSSNLKGHI